MYWLHSFSLSLSLGVHKRSTIYKVSTRVHAGPHGYVYTVVVEYRDVVDLDGVEGNQDPVDYHAGIEGQEWAGGWCSIGFGKNRWIDH